jgi:hypothetical protein
MFDFESISGEVDSIQQYVIQIVIGIWPATPVFCTNKIVRHEMNIEILLKIVLNTVTPNPIK